MTGVVDISRPFLIQYHHAHPDSTGKVFASEDNLSDATREERGPSLADYVA